MNSAPEKTELLSFGIAGDVYAIPLARVREIVACRAIARVPGAGKSLRGVMNLRGSVVPVIDLARHFGFGETTLSDTTCALLLDSPIDGESSPVAGLVENIRGVVEAGELDAAPEFGTPVSPSMLRGITPQGEGFAYVVNLEAVLKSLI